MAAAKKETMMCGGWGGARSGGDLSTMQAKLEAVRTNCERTAGRTFDAWELISYQESTQVVAGTNYSWVCKVKVGKSEDGQDQLAECKMKQFVALRPPIEAPRLTGFRILHGNATDVGQSEAIVQMVATPIHFAVAEVGEEEGFKN